MGNLMLPPEGFRVAGVTAASVFGRSRDDGRVVMLLRCDGAILMIVVDDAVRAEPSSSEGFDTWRHSKSFGVVSRAIVVAHFCSVQQGCFLSLWYAVQRSGLGIMACVSISTGNLECMAKMGV